MALIGTIPDPAGGKALSVDLVTSCLATYGALVYDVKIAGSRIQVDLPPKSSLAERLARISSSYQAQKAAEAEALAEAQARALIVSIDVPITEEAAIKEALATKGGSVLVAVPAEKVDAVKAEIAKPIIKEPIEKEAL